MLCKHIFFHAGLPNVGKCGKGWNGSADVGCVAEVLSRQDVVEAVEQTGAGAATGFAPLAVLLLMLVLPHLHK